MSLEEEFISQLKLLLSRCNQNDYYDHFHHMIILFEFIHNTINILNKEKMSFIKLLIVNKAKQIQKQLESNEVYFSTIYFEVEKKYMLYLLQSILENEKI